MKKLLDIHRYGDPVLRQAATPFPTPLPADLPALARAMFATMRAADGCGLAAQQVGLTQAICVVEIPPSADVEDEGGPRLNPDSYRAFKHTPKNRQKVEIDLFNEALERVVAAHPDWELEGYKLQEVKK